jgi:hypothetical protein
MRVILSGMLGLALIFPAEVLAAPPAGDNVLGIYSDESDGENHLEGPSGNVELFLVVSGLTEPSGVGGWECSVEWPFDQGWFWLEPELQGPAFNLSPEEGQFIVGVGSSPLLPDGSGNVTLAILNLVVSSGRGYFYLRPAAEPSVPGQMSFVPGNDFNRILAFNWPYGEDGPVFGINTGPVDEYGRDSSTWGQVKASYH